MADLPVVGDESIYLRWAEIITGQGGWFVSLLDGKPPLSYWLYAAARLLSDDPLLGPRWISVLAGTATTAAVCAVGSALRNARVGLLAASLYAVLPWAMLYDRLAYTESLVNLGGAVVAWLSVRLVRQEPPSGTAAAAVGLALGLALFTKTTALLYAPAPLLAALTVGKASWREWGPKLALVCAIAACFPALSAALTPEAPQLADHSALLHKTHFFVTPAELLSNPTGRLGENLPLLLEFLGAYLSWPLLLAAVGAFVVLVRRRDPAAWFLLGLSALPMLAEALLLTRFFSRYPFPHAWPLLVATALAADALWDAPRLRTPVRAGSAALAALLLTMSLRIVYAPQAGMAWADSTYYFSDSPAAGWGLEQVVAAVRQEARGGPVLLLTDPIWGTPADALFAYLNGRDGVRVAEAWWLEADPNAPLIPGREVEVWRSHYERTPGGSIDFSRYRAVFYATVTNYRRPEEVAARAPGARRVLSVPKPGGAQSLDLYRLR